MSNFNKKEIRNNIVALGYEAKKIVSVKPCLKAASPSYSDGGQLITLEGESSPRFSYATDNEVGDYYYV